MSLLDPFLPHVQRAAQAHEHYMARMTAAIEETAREARQMSDLGRPDTGDVSKYVILNAAGVGAGQQILQNGETPALGEAWMLQQVITNGKGVKSPAFVIRTNTGRLLFSSELEQNTTQNVGGNAMLRPGENLILESAGGNFDFILAFSLRKEQRPAPDAGYGVSEEVYEERFHAEHEVERDALPALGQAMPHAPLVQQ